MSLSEAQEIVRAALPHLKRRPLRAAAITYLNWWNGNSEKLSHSDPTGERAVRRIIGYFDTDPTSA